MSTTLVDQAAGYATPDGGFLLTNAVLYFADGTTETLTNKQYTRDQYQAARAYLGLEVKPSQFAQASDPTPPATPQEDDRDVANFIAMTERWLRLVAHPSPQTPPTPPTAPAISI